MRDKYRQKYQNYKSEHLDDVNREKVDMDKGEKEFRSLVDKFVAGLVLQHVRPQEIIILQSDPILDPDGNVEDEDKAKFYIILNGQCKVKSLKFNKRKKQQVDKSADLNLESLETLT